VSFLRIADFPHIIPVSGFYCEACCDFFFDEPSTLEHCASNEHTQKVRRLSSRGFCGDSSVVECPPLNWKVGCSIQAHWVNRHRARAFTSTAKSKFQVSVCWYFHHQNQIFKIAACLKSCNARTASPRLLSFCPKVNQSSLWPTWCVCKSYEKLLHEKTEMTCSHLQKNQKLARTKTWDRSFVKPPHLLHHRSCGLGSNPGRVTRKPWKTVLAGCSASCSGSMCECKGKVLPLARHQCSIHCKSSRVTHGVDRESSDGWPHVTLWSSGA